MNENKHEILINVHYTIVSTAQMVKDNKKCIELILFSLSPVPPSLPFSPELRIGTVEK